MWDEPNPAVQRNCLPISAVGTRCFSCWKSAVTPLVPPGGKHLKFVGFCLYFFKSLRPAGSQSGRRRPNASCSDSNKGWISAGQ